MSASTPNDWTDEQRGLFDKVRAFVASNQDGIRHPDCLPLAANHWNTIAHNAAWAAAELMDADELRVFADGRVIAVSPPATPNA